MKDKEAWTAYTIIDTKNPSFSEDIFASLTDDFSSSASYSYTSSEEELFPSSESSYSDSDEELQFKLDDLPIFFQKTNLKPSLNPSKLLVPLPRLQTQNSLKSHCLVQIHLLNAWNIYQERLQSAREAYQCLEKPSWFQCLIAEKGFIYYVLLFFKVFDDYLKPTLLICSRYKDRDSEIIRRKRQAEQCFKQETQRIYEKSQEIPIYNKTPVQNTFESLLSSKTLNSSLLKAIITEIQTAESCEQEQSKTIDSRHVRLLDSDLDDHEAFRCTT